MDTTAREEPVRPQKAGRRRDYARRPSWLNELLFWPFWVAVGLFARVWFRFRVHNRPRLEGGYVLAANHTSFLDPMLVGGAVPRRVAFLMTEIVFRSPSMGWFYRWNHAIPLSIRGGNREALRAARDILRQGRVVGIFPEGGLSRDGLLLLGSPGAVSLVLGESLPIVPVGIVGADRALPPGCVLPRPRRIEVFFGEPITAEELEALAPGDRKARLANATRLIMERIAALTGQTPREQQIARGS